MTSKRINHSALAKTLKYLQRHRHVGAAALATYTGVHPTTASAWLRALRVEGAVHIAAWAQDTMGRDATPLYALGAGEDTPRSRRSRSDIMKAYRQRQKEKA